jgi:hypothetical protein
MGSVGFIVRHAHFRRCWQTFLGMSQLPANERFYDGKFGVLGLRLSAHVL